MFSNKKILKLPLRISLAILLFGLLAKMFEWPLATKTLLFGFASLGVLYVVRFIKKTDKEFLDYNKLALVSFWSLYGTFTVLNFPYTLFFLIMTALAFILWFVMEGTAYFLDEDRRTKNSLYHILWNFALVLATLGVISGSLLRILNWDYAIHILSIGITMIAAYILKDVFVPENPNDEEHNHEEFQL
jgi:putative exporter of polyketide antibiotics